MDSIFPTTYQAWASLSDEERGEIFQTLNPYKEHPIFEWVSNDFKSWAQKQDGVIEASLGNNHGTMELRIAWNKEIDLRQVSPLFMGIPIRNMHVVTEEERKQWEHAYKSSIDFKLNQLISWLMIIPMAILNTLIALPVIIIMMLIGKRKL